MSEQGNSGFYGHSAKPGRPEPQSQVTMPQWGPPPAPQPSVAASPPPTGAAPSTGGSGATATAPAHRPATQNAPAPLVQGVMARAKGDDPRALETLFGQFIPPGEQIVETRYMGIMGLWGFGTHSFAAVTTQRLASMRVGMFGALLYQDGSLEYINSSAVHQPSRLQMYAPVAIMVAVIAVVAFTALPPAIALIPVLVTLLLVPVLVKLQYRLRKSGMVVWVREGLAVHIFIDRPRIALANRFYRLVCELRDERLREIGHP